MSATDSLQSGKTSPGAVEKGPSGTLYAKVVSLVKSKVDSGEWPAGTQLPSLEDLAALFGVSRVTVRQAMGLLEAEGQIRRRQGVGTFIAEGAGQRYSIVVQTEWASLVDSIKGSSTQQLESFNTDSAEMGQTHKSEEEGSFRFMRRLLSRDNSPLVLIDLYVASSIYQMAPNDFDSHPIVRVIDKMANICIGRAEQVLTITSANYTTANFLGIQVGQPIVEVKRTIYDPADNLIYLARLKYRADKYCLTMQIKL